MGVPKLMQGGTTKKHRSQNLLEEPGEQTMGKAKAIAQEETTPTHSTDDISEHVGVFGPRENTTN